MKKQSLQPLIILKKDFRLRGKKKFIVISGIFSDEYADALQIRFLK